MKSENLKSSFHYAIEGIIQGFKSERNLRIHFIFSIIVIIVAMILKFSLTDVAILLLCIGMVIITELFNTTVEYIMDHIHPKVHKKVKIIKDLSAGAVLIASLLSAIVGVMLFTKYIVRLL